jgi:hypothetical protein
VIETDRLTQEQPGHHPTQQNQMTLVGYWAVLTEKGDQLTMEPGMGCHEGLVWCDDPKLS